MHWSTITMFFAAAVLGAPAPTTFALDPNVMDQGDGFYLASFNEAGKAEVEFTPMAEIIARDSVPVSENLAVRAVDTLLKRKTHCGGSSNNVGDLDWANVKLAQNGDQKWYDAGHWGWVHNKGETSFFCNYQRNYLTYQLIIDMHVVISSQCNGSPAYGWDRRTNGGGANDLSVGRTFRGDHFCDNYSHGR